MQKLRIFAASPSDMATERAKVESVAAMLKPLADNLDIVLDVSDWRAVVPDMGRPEQVILDQLKPTEWDVLIGILWHRFGTPPGAKESQTGKEYLGGTEEEFKTAYNLWKKDGKPRVIMYRCTRAIPPDAVDPDQFKRVKQFFAQFDAVKGEHPGLFQSFDTADGFEKLLLQHLQKFLIDYGEKIRGKPITPEIVQTYAPKIPNNLPRRQSFFGRDKDMDKMLGALSPDERGWGVVIDGIGGIGKTALALEAAYRTQHHSMFDAFVFVSAKTNILETSGIRDLVPATTTLDSFINETARVLGQPGITQLTGEDRNRALLDVLRGTRALLIYDNLETLSEGEQKALADFLRFLPQNSKAILTSRRRGGEGALWLRLEKLEWDDARAIIVDEAKKDSRLDKKLRHAGEARWRELYDETKGSPLALVHVLGLMRVRIALMFDGTLELLRGNRDADLQKFVFQEARKELKENDIATLRALSMFTPSASFEALMDVADLSRNTLDMALDRLDALSLLDKVEGAERFSLHPLTRDYARTELLADAKIAHETGMRFAKHWVAFAKRNSGRRQHYKSFNLLVDEWQNLSATAEWLWKTASVQGEVVCDKDAAKMLNDLVNALRRFLWFNGRWDEDVQWNSNAYEAMRALNNWGKAGSRAYVVAWILYNRGKTDDASCWADLCGEAWTRGGSELQQSAGMRLRGLVHRQRQDYDAAERFLQKALATRRDFKDKRWIAILLSDLGEMERGRSRHEEAERYYREALVLDDELEDKEGLAVRYGNLGALALDRKQWAESREWYEKCLPLVVEIGRQNLSARVKFGLARVHEEQGRPDLALPLAQEALAIHERLRTKDLDEAKRLLERLRKTVTGT